MLPAAKFAQQEAGCLISETGNVVPPLQVLLRAYQEPTDQVQDHFSDNHCNASMMSPDAFSETEPTKDPLALSFAGTSPISENENSMSENNNGYASLSVKLEIQHRKRPLSACDDCSTLGSPKRRRLDSGESRRCDSESGFSSDAATDNATEINLVKCDNVRSPVSGDEGTGVDVFHLKPRPNKSLSSSPDDTGASVESSSLSMHSPLDLTYSLPTSEPGPQPRPTFSFSVASPYSYRRDYTFCAKCPVKVQPLDLTTTSPAVIDEAIPSRKITKTCVNVSNQQICTEPQFLTEKLNYSTTGLDLNCSETDTEASHSHQTQSSELTADCLELQAKPTGGAAVALILSPREVEAQVESCVTELSKLTTATNKKEASSNKPQQETSLAQHQQNFIVSQPTEAMATFPSENHQASVSELASQCLQDFFHNWNDNSSPIVNDSYSNDILLFPNLDMGCIDISLHQTNPEIAQILVMETSPSLIETEETVACDAEEGEGEDPLGPLALPHKASPRQSRRRPLLSMPLLGGEPELPPISEEEDESQEEEEPAASSETLATVCGEAASSETLAPDPAAPPADPQSIADPPASSESADNDPQIGMLDKIQKPTLPQNSTLAYSRFFARYNENNLVKAFLARPGVTPTSCAPVLNSKRSKTPTPQKRAQVQTAERRLSLSSLGSESLQVAYSSPTTRSLTLRQMQAAASPLLSQVTPSPQPAQPAPQVLQNGRMSVPQSCEPLSTPKRGRGRPPSAKKIIGNVRSAAPKKSASPSIKKKHQLAAVKVNKKPQRSSSPAVDRESLLVERERQHDSWLEQRHVLYSALLPGVPLRRSAKMQPYVVLERNPGLDARVVSEEALASQQQQQPSSPQA